mgnify:FL=1
MPTLYLAIDARKAKEGAKEHEQATDAIDRGAKKAGDAMDKLKERTGKAWDILKAMFKGMVAGAAAIFGAVSAFTALNVATASAIDNLTDTAQALQLTVEQVSLLEYAADRAGTNLGDISGAIRAVAAQAQAASLGDEKAVGLFNFLGVDPNGQDPIALTSAVATAIGNIEDKTQKLAYSQDLLGRSGFKVIELFKDQGAGFRDVADDARRLGAIIDQDLSRVAADLVDTWADFKKSLSGVANEILRSSGPTITDFLKSIADTIAKNRFNIGAFFEALSKSAGELIEIVKNGGILSNLSAITEFLTSGLVSIFINVTPPLVTSATALGISLGVAIIQGIINGIADQLPELVKKFGGLSGLIPDEYNPFFILAKEFSEGIKTSPKIIQEANKKAVDVVVGSWSGVGDAIKNDLESGYGDFLNNVDTDTASRIKKIVGYFQEIPKKALEAEESAKLNQRVYGINPSPSAPSAPQIVRKDISDRLKAIQSIESLVRAKEQELEMIGLTDREREKALFNLELEKQAFELSTAEIDRAREAYGKLVDELSDAAKNREVANAWANAIGSGTEEAILHFENLRDIALGVFEDIRRASIRALVTQPLQEQIAGGLGSLFQGANLFGSARGNIFAGGSLVPFSMGGITNGIGYAPMSDGRTAMYGESKPELIAPVQRGPGGRIGLEMSGLQPRVGSLHFHYHGNGTRQDQDGFRQSSRQAAADVRRMLEA